jgi:hypothetical protein
MLVPGSSKKRSRQYIFQHLFHHTSDAQRYVERLVLLSSSLCTAEKCTEHSNSPTGKCLDSPFAPNYIRSFGNRPPTSPSGITCRARTPFKGCRWQTRMRIRTTTTIVDCTLWAAFPFTTNAKDREIEIESTEGELKGI